MYLFQSIDTYLYIIYLVEKIRQRWFVSVSEDGAIERIPIV